ncbi:MAG: pseudaminic acid biosynthesis-associated methylase [Polyangiaceae bacterium]|nr:pseudaminic acid biosynthesis-associated methylase [Polyangiaceae bacterium]
MIKSGYSTEQEGFWAGEFGDEYTSRNQGAEHHASNLVFFSKVLSRARGVRSVLELGANRGLNLHALRALLPGAELAGVEINAGAAEILRGAGFTTYNQSLLEFRPEAQRDLVFTKGVQIHLAPEALPKVYDLLHAASRRWVLVAEYYNTSPVEIPYRGHSGKLFKRDFAGELMERHPDLALVDYGFLYRRDAAYFEVQDDITWFLMEKRGG